MAMAIDWMVVVVEERMRMGKGKGSMPSWVMKYTFAPGGNNP